MGSSRYKVVTAASGVLAILAVLTATGCSDDPAAPATAADTPRRGGTLYLIKEGDKFTHLDPQRVYVAPDLNTSRLIYRTLTTYASAPGDKGSELRPDLATDLGRPSEGNTVWEYTLKPGLKWEDGEPVTCPQVKYGVERSFAKDLDGGPDYPDRYLAGGDNYPGPYQNGNNGGRGLDAIRCLDDRTVQFRLKRSVGDFGYMVALPVFAPVRQDKDTRTDYDRRPLSNGPYKIASNDPEGAKELVLERNGHWDRRTDPVRKAYPDRIVVRFGVTAAQITHDLIGGQGDYRYAVQLDSRIPNNFIQQVVNDPALSRRVVAGVRGTIRYLAINTRTVRDLRCRQALTYAFNRRTFRATLGASFYGDYASTMLPPTMRAYKDFDLYGARTSPDGNEDRALQLLSEVRNCPTRLTLDYQGTAEYKRAVRTIVDQYVHIGIQVVENPIAKADFYNVVSNPSLQHDLVLAGWLPDWANGSGTIPQLFDGRSIPANESGNYNFSMLSDAEVHRLIDAAMNEPDLGKQYAMWGDIDEKAQQLAATVPIVYEKAQQLVGSHVRGAYLHAFYGQADVSALGLV